MTYSVGWHTWEPGLQGKMSSGGGAEWTKFLWKRLRSAGYEVVDLTKPLKGQRIDKAVFCWRWDFNEPGYEDRHYSYVRQMELIESLHKAGTKIMVHDQDYKMAPADLEWLQSLGVGLYEPSILPRPGFSTLHFPYPWTVSGRAKTKAPYNRLIYIGNNYERYDQMKAYIGGMKRQDQVTVYGNWLERSPLRESPEQVRADFPYVNFGGRLEQSRIMDFLPNFQATIHLAKPEYCKSGFITIRWAEAARAGTIGLIPAEFAPIPLLEELYVSPSQLEEKLERIVHQRDYALELLTLQQDFVEATMRAQDWAFILNRL